MDSNNELKEVKEKGDDFYRITMTRDAEKALSDLINKANDGFYGGKINRTQLVSWALIRLNSDVTEGQLQDLRAAHFDDFSALESLLKRAKDMGEISPELKTILMKEVGFAAPVKRTPKKQN